MACFPCSTDPDVTKWCPLTTPEWRDSFTPEQKALGGDYVHSMEQGVSVQDSENSEIDSNAMSRAVALTSTTGNSQSSLGCIDNTELEQGFIGTNEINNSFDLNQVLVDNPSFLDQISMDRWSNLPQMGEEIIPPQPQFFTLEDGTIQ
ncbi:hypothetical protein TREMEDRAFT_60401 [Tremella mesenterica DSM 1558]|nr:uncharacterized protein TREMEDRAFT_60401 [Tremella mesenterica DSM 1558]EIW71474.1 hypothetical protein TREMEDRAFT_60401 [Tremella mesenterica DSM 1558]